MDLTERRKRLRRILAGSECVYPASVHDPLSAHLADSMGFETGILGGSVASFVALGAPDLAVLTLTEFADLIRRITRYSSISLLVDADHGYGHALHARRTVEELEAAGICGMTLEDTLLPVPFGSARPDTLISIPEMVGKLKGAVAARSDPNTVIAGRTRLAGPETLPGCLERLKAFESTGVDALFLVGVRDLAELDAIAKNTSLPLIVNRTPPGVDPKTLASRRVRMALHGHQPVYAALQAIHDTYKHLLQGGKPEDLAGSIASEDLMGQATHSADYIRLRKEFLS